MINQTKIDRTISLCTVSHSEFTFMRETLQLVNLPGKRMIKMILR